MNLILAELISNITIVNSNMWTSSTWKKEIFFLLAFRCLFLEFLKFWCDEININIFTCQKSLTTSKIFQFCKHFIQLLKNDSSFGGVCPMLKSARFNFYPPSDSMVFLIQSKLRNISDQTLRPSPPHPFSLQPPSKTPANVCSPSSIKYNGP